MKTPSGIKETFEMVESIDKLPDITDLVPSSTPARSGAAR